MDDDRFARMVHRNLHYWHGELDGVTNEALLALGDKFSLVCRAIRFGLQREAFVQESAQLVLTASGFAERTGNWAVWIEILDDTLAHADSFFEDALLLRKGWFCRLAHRFDESVAAYERVRVSAENHDSHTLAKATVGLAICYLTKEDYQNAETFLTPSIVSMVSNISDSDLLAQTINGLGWLHFYGKGDLDVAENYFLEAKKVYQDLNDPFNCARVYHNLGTLYNRRKQADKSREYLLLAQQFTDPNIADVAQNRLSLGHLYFELEQWKEAEREFELIDIAYLERNGYVRLQASALNNLGNAMLKQKKCKQAYRVLNMAKQLWLDLGNEGQYANTLGAIGEVYYIEGNWKMALACTQEAVELLAEDIDIINLEEQVWLGEYRILLAEIKAKMG